LKWTIGFDLISQQACFLPLRSVIFPHTTQNADDDHIRSDTNGLSAGVTILEAIVNGLFEIIERDAIARIVPDGPQRITASDLPESSALLAKRFADNEVQLSINLCPSPTGVPVFYCISRDDVLRCSSLFCSGSGAHLMPEIALERAITETAQSRAGFISSVRFDASTQIMQMRDVPYEQRKEELASWFNHAGAVAFPYQQSCDMPTLNHILAELIRRFESSYPNPIVACFPLYRDGHIAAVRVYCPQMREAARDKWSA
jgi:ribosomal protein S12 methylthiotransferase accessory factor